MYFLCICIVLCWKPVRCISLSALKVVEGGINMGMRLLCLWLYISLTSYSHDNVCVTLLLGISQ